MRYIEEHVSAKERIIAKAQYSKWVFLREVILLIVLGGACAALYFLVDAVKDYFWYIVGGCGGIFLISLLAHIFQRSGQELVLTSTKLIGKRGFFNIKVVSTQLSQVTNLEARSSILGRIFGYGTIYVTTQSRTYSYGPIIQPAKFVNAVNRSIARGKGRARRKQIVIRFGMTKPKAFKQPAPLPNYQAPVNSMPQGEYTVQ